MSRRPNVLLLFSDEHRHDALGCADHALVKTPHLDALAASGTRFTQAYTPSPICVPARASLATGQYVHKNRCWSNAQAYAGEPKSWGHHLISQGHSVDAIGKLHYRGSDTKNGFEKEMLPMYIRDGIGWIKGLLRDHEAFFDVSSYVREIGPGHDRYTEYDLGVTRAACEWLHQKGGQTEAKPWTLFVSWLRPHYPLVCPPEFYALYPLEKMDHARFTETDELPLHPVTRTLRRHFNYDDAFDERSRQIARASYYGLCSFLDAQVGQVIDVLKATGQADNTLVIYTSDHGDHNGDRRLWTKMTLYDEAARIPMILSGPDIARGHETDALASLVDVYPTVMETVGAKSDAIERPGLSLASLSASPLADRAVLSEYHDGGSPVGMFMLRTGRWKYNYYPGYAPELFDLYADPDELNDLAEDPSYADDLARCHRALTGIVDPDAANQTAFADQARRIAELGGVERIMASEEFDHTPVPV